MKFVEYLNVIGVVFVALKLVGAITWSWWWVTLPFLVCVFSVVLSCLIFGVVLALITFLNKI
jgi:hypothetical protein